MLTRWYAGALAVVLALYAGGVSVFISHNLSKQLDRELRQDFDFAEGMLVRTATSGVGWRSDDTGDEEGGDLHGWVEVWSRDGKLLYRSGPNAEAGRVGAATSVAPRRYGFHSGTFPEAGAVRLLNGPSSIDGLPVVIRVARSARDARHELSDLLLILALGFPLGIAAAGFGGHLLARRALAPVAGMTEQARLITAQRLGDPLEVANPDDEIGQLARVLNEAFGRVARSFEQQRHLTIDASLGLRTPLAAMRSRGDLGLREHRNEAGYREIIAGMLEDADCLAKLVERHLALSQGNIGQVPLACERTDLGALSREVVGQLRALAEERQQSITLDAQGRVCATVDRVVFRQAIVHLVGLAIKEGPAAASIGVVVADHPDGPRIEVRPGGSGFLREYRDRVSDRFSGVDTSGLAAPGIALDFSLACWAVEVHGGRVSLEDSEGGGSTFRITLPPEGGPRAKTIPA